MIIKPAFSPSAKDILRPLPVARREQEPIEKPEQMLERVAKHVAGAESSLAMQYKWADEFYDVMAKLLFAQQHPLNSGRPAPHGQLAACFVIGKIP